MTERSGNSKILKTDKIKENIKIWRMMEVGNKYQGI